MRLNAVLGQLVQQARRKMQTRGRCGHGTRLPGIDGLVTLLIGGLRLSLADVGRQWYLAVTLEQVQRRALRVGTDQPASFRGSTDQGQA